MKIIGMTSGLNGGCKRFLVEAEEEELALIAGYGGPSAARICIGSTVKVCEAWQIIERHHNASHHLAEAAKSLRALAELCEQQDPILVMPEEGKVP